MIVFVHDFFMFNHQRQTEKDEVTSMTHHRDCRTDSLTFSC
jgi:hypothetical protein